MGPGGLPTGHVLARGACALSYAVNQGSQAGPFCSHCCLQGRRQGRRTLPSPVVLPSPRITPGLKRTLLLSWTRSVRGQGPS